ncbi:NAD(P)H-dependent glycerol-3-phosphate dehydrogenase [Ureaplasma ceti]|uniref:Glycerol-3-phosphate dehydrogenase n=1 Tax=Ureaplasma ceti TaxID=3119530 RepID=A0ABP9U4Y6_9BACT
MITKSKILILGTGAFGTALSQPLIDNGHEVYFFSKNQAVLEELTKGQHHLFPNTHLSTPTGTFSSLQEAFATVKFNFILLAVPSKALPVVYEELKPFLNKEIAIINTSKGLANNAEGVWSNLFKKDNLNEHYALIVGPSFADEIVTRQKTIVNVVSDDPEFNLSVCNIFNNNYFKMIPFGDEFVASLASSFKNSLALALGLLSTFTESLNTRSAYLTIGVSEIQKIINVLEPHFKRSILHFFGIGDIFLTCNSEMSRNYSFGKLIGKVGFAEANKQQSGTTIEGVRTLTFIHRYAEEYQLQLPLFDILYQICYENKSHTSFVEDVWQAFK